MRKVDDVDAFIKSKVETCCVVEDCSCRKNFFGFCGESGHRYVTIKEHKVRHIDELTDDDSFHEVELEDLLMEIKKAKDTGEILFLLVEPEEERPLRIIEVE